MAENQEPGLRARRFGPKPPGAAMDTPLRLSPLEKQTLKNLDAGQNEPSELDWLALHRLKRLGLVEAQSTGRGVRITKEDARAEGFGGQIGRGTTGADGVVRCSWREVPAEYSPAT